MSPPFVMAADLPDQTDVVVIGAGAAGLAAAIFVGSASLPPTLAARRRPRVVLLDGAKSPGAKILVSGGSRCNVTNVSVRERDFWTQGSAAVIRRVLRAFTVPETIAWFRQMGVPLHEEEHGKLFPDSNRSRDVLEALLTRVRQCGATICTGARVQELTRTDDSFTVATSRGIVRARAVVLATGGRALPKSGSDGGGYVLAASFGHHIVPTTPALAPLVLAGEPGRPSALHGRLSGVSHAVDMTVWVDGAVHTRLAGSLLWTHFGVSGPVALNASRLIERARLNGQVVRLTISFFPGCLFEQVDRHLTSLGAERPKITTLSALSQSLPTSVAEALLEHIGIPPGQQLSQLPRADRHRLAHALSAWDLPVVGTRGYTYAEATAGGVDLAEIDPRTLESRMCAGLYLVGEILDVDGRLGGYNFQWAWSSGHVAGLALARRAAERGWS